LQEAIGHGLVSPIDSVMQRSAIELVPGFHRGLGTQLEEYFDKTMERYKIEYSDEQAEA